MPCYHPVKGYWSRDRNPSGKRSITFNPKQAYSDLKVEIPCGRCIGCRLERSRQWAIRCIHEAELYEDNCFITLTYDDKHLPKNGSLNVEHFQNFIKYFRKALHEKYIENLQKWRNLSTLDKGENTDTKSLTEKKSGASNAHQTNHVDEKNKKIIKKQIYKIKPKPTLIRYFHCGEYGEKYSRPHYHACIFNYDFPDKTYFKEHNGEKYYISNELKTLWTQGHSIIGNVTFESAAYVARYITKKVTGPRADNHYKDLKPEYTTMSRRPGIGKKWFDKFQKDFEQGDFIVIKGKEMKIPKYYNTQIELQSQEAYAKIKAKRVVEGKTRAEDNTHERLMVKKHLKEKQTLELKRNYENGT